MDLLVSCELRADYAGRLDWYPKDDSGGATARAVYQTVVGELDARLVSAYWLGGFMVVA